jgi:hypothetical protein
MAKMKDSHLGWILGGLAVAVVGGVAWFEYNKNQNASASGNPPSPSPTPASPPPPATPATPPAGTPDPSEGS